MYKPDNIAYLWLSFVLCVLFIMPGINAVRHFNLQQDCVDQTPQYGGIECDNLLMVAYTLQWFVPLMLWLWITGIKFVSKKWLRVAG